MTPTFAAVIVALKPTGIALIIGVLAFAFVVWDFGGVRQVPIAKARNPKYPVGNMALWVLVLSVLFAAWYILTGQHWPGWTMELGR